MSTRARLESARGGRGTSFVCLAVIVMSPGVASAEDGATGAASGCQPAALATGVVGTVVDGRTFVLDDGREVRLAAIEVPDDTDQGSDSGRGGRAKATLQEVVAGRAVVLRRLGPERDRHGRLLAQVFLAESKPERWIQAAMIRSGHARMAARVGDRACAAELFSHERAARDAKLGLWADPYYVMRRADDPAAVSRERGRFTIVEGSVLSVRESGGTIYVNFGKRWSEDFTVTIAKRNERVFATAGVEPKRLAGRRVRVRGWIEERGGPWVEATRPEQIEVLERN
jgi:endonuclease YncB( thermonuclease family)